MILIKIILIICLALKVMKLLNLFLPTSNLIFSFPSHPTTCNPTLVILVTSLPYHKLMEMIPFFPPPPTIPPNLSLMPLVSLTPLPWELNRKLML